MITVEQRMVMIEKQYNDLCESLHTRRHYMARFKGAGLEPTHVAMGREELHLVECLAQPGHFVFNPQTRDKEFLGLKIIPVDMLRYFEVLYADTGL